MLMTAQDSLLLIVDMQERMVGHVHEPERLVRHCAWLMEVASELAVPALVVEHYPRGLGRTVAELRLLAPPAGFMEKVHFAVGKSPECLARVEATGRRQVVVVGVEAHVCVLQTALSLHDAGREVFVVADAVSSRDPLDAACAIERMRTAGVWVVTREMVFFEWLERAGTDRFRQLNERFCKHP